jgi:general stress protein YciG
MCNKNKHGNAVGCSGRQPHYPNRRPLCYFIPDEDSNRYKHPSAMEREGDMATTKGSSGKSGTGKSKRGFASMDPVKQREIASKGGKAAHEKGTAHEFTPEEAAAAGRKGGLASGRGRTSKSSAS